MAACSACQATFTPSGGPGRPRLFCARCSPVKVDLGRRLSLYARDGWHCALCREPVEIADPNGDRAPSLDHIVPRSRGGSDDDDNLRLVHRVCNSRRGDRVEVEEGNVA